MLYNLNWLDEGRSFPPIVEVPRIERYVQNSILFDGEHFSGRAFRHRNGVMVSPLRMYEDCCRRISRVVGNFEDIISAPILLNYQRFISLKMADLVAGEPPTITGATEEENSKIKWIRDNSSFDEKLYSIVLDLSRYGDAPIRYYLDEQDGLVKFTLWDATGWYPIVSQDGTYRITSHCLCWLYNEQPDIEEQDDWYLHVQIHSVNAPGSYVYRVYHNGGNRNIIGKLVKEEIVPTGLEVCAVDHIRSFAVSGTVYGYDDYTPIDSCLAEIMTRISQISAILDKHSDPSLVGPSTMLSLDPESGEYRLVSGKYFLVDGDDQKPEYLTWDGQLSSAFQQLEFLLNQLFVLSEMGAAFDREGGSNAVSGTAMRFKMVNPLAKARRVSNSLTSAVKKIFSVIGSNMPDIDNETSEPGSGSDTPLYSSHISVQWEDGLPDDPREQIENCKLATGESKMLPLEDGLMVYYKKSAQEAQQLVQKLKQNAQEAVAQEADVNHPGPQDGTGVNPQKKGSETSLSNFQAENNKPSEE